jgi:hypothetical protein
MWDIFTGLFPPDEANVEQTQRWRRSISAVVIATGAITIVSNLLIWGLVPFLFSGFASVSSVQAATDKIDETRKEVERVQQSIESQSRQMRRDTDKLEAALMLSQLNQIFDAMCGAIRNQRREEADQWEKQFTDKIIEYNTLTGQVYPMRNCG